MDRLGAVADRLGSFALGESAGRLNSMLCAIDLGVRYLLKFPKRGSMIPNQGPALRERYTTANRIRGGKATVNVAIRNARGLVREDEAAAMGLGSVLSTSCTSERG